MVFEYLPGDLLQVRMSALDVSHVIYTRRAQFHVTCTCTRVCPTVLARSVVCSWCVLPKPLLPHEAARCLATRHQWSTHTWLSLAVSFHGVALEHTRAVGNALAFNVHRAPLTRVMLAHVMLLCRF